MFLDGIFKSSRAVSLNNLLPRRGEPLGPHLDFLSEHRLKTCHANCSYIYQFPSSEFPKDLFDRIFSYLQAHGGSLSTVYDEGAGNGPYAQKLRSRFKHVIVSDIVAKNIELAQDRFSTDGYSYYVAKVEEADEITAGSVDMVFSTNVMYFPDQKIVMSAIVEPLKSGESFACGTFGAARFEDAKL